MSYASNCQDKTDMSSTSDLRLIQRPRLEHSLPSPLFTSLAHTTMPLCDAGILAPGYGTRKALASHEPSCRGLRREAV